MTNVLINTYVFFFSDCAVGYLHEDGYHHSLRTSDAYITKWDTFLKQFLGCAVSPICVQYIGHYIFKQLLKIHCPLKTNCTEIFNAAMDLTYEEINAIRYAAGYVPRAWS